jgi:hypothetical protein
MPSFWRGTARVMDLFGTLTRYNTFASAKDADTTAMKRDWEIVGQDIKDAVKEYESTLPRK